MADVLLRYLERARARDRKLARRLLLPQSSQPIPGTDSVLQTALIFVNITARWREETERRKQWVPASRQPPEAFFQQPSAEDAGDGPGIPIPSAGTAAVVPCHVCNETGRTGCTTCMNCGNLPCHRCQGPAASHNGVEPCQSCSGLGRVACESCNGEGSVIHGLCGGEGRLCTWDEVTYRWATEPRRVATTLPTGVPVSEVESAAAQWLEEHPREPVRVLDPAVLVAEVGYDTSALRSVIAEAREVVESLRKHMDPDKSMAARGSNSGHQLMSVTATYEVVPLSGYTYVRSVNRSDRGFWLVGQGECAIELPWLADPDFALRWVLVSALISSGTALIPLVSAPALAAYAGFVTWSILSVEGAAGEIVSALRLAISRPRQLRTVALLGQPSRVSLYMSCLASVGSHARRLEVMGARARRQVERLINVSAPTDHHAPLVVRLSDGRPVRFISVEAPQTAEAWSTLKRSVDGIVTLDPSASAVFGTPGPTSDMLENLRRSYVEDLGDHGRWGAAFNELWAPIERALNATVRRKASWPLGAGRFAWRVVLGRRRRMLNSGSTT